jgi:hypothetical protein
LCIEVLEHSNDKRHVGFLEHRIGTVCCIENASTAPWVAKNTNLRVLGVFVLLWVCIIKVLY